MTVRDTLVSVAYPGMPSEQVENLLARPVEAQLRELAGIKRIVTTVRPGSAIVQLTAYDDVQDLPALWQHVRAKAAEAGAQCLPARLVRSSTTTSGACRWPRLQSPRQAFR